MRASPHPCTDRSEYGWRWPRCRHCLSVLSCVQPHQHPTSSRPHDSLLRPERGSLSLDLLPESAIEAQTNLENRRWSATLSSLCSLPVLTIYTRMGFRSRDYSSLPVVSNLICSYFPTLS